MLRTLAALASLTLSGCQSMPSSESGFLRREVRLASKTYPYVVWAPPAHRAGLPVVLFLHGAGERGSDGWRQTEVGLGAAIRWNPQRFEHVIVVFPQAPAEERWLDEPARAAMMALDKTLSEFRGDRRRVYLTGISMGGYGTWYLATEYPDRFAALVPVCGGIVPSEATTSVRQLPRTMNTENPYAVAAEAVPRIPIWIFHGAADRVIPVSESRGMSEELKSRGYEVQYTEYPQVGHNCWDKAYGEEALWNWMLKK